MALLIDFSVLITLERRGALPADLDRVVNNELIALAAITASELLVGVHRADTPVRRNRREAFVETVFATVPILPFDLPVARVHAELWSHLMATGRMIGAHDLLIAATALANGYSVLTENEREFRCVPGLIVHRPSW